MTRPFIHCALFVAALLCSPCESMGATFANTNSIAINAVGAATPYPSSINVSGLTGFISKVTVTLSNLNHTWPSDIDVLLVSPAQQAVILMSDAGDDFSISSVTLTFDDAAPGTLPSASQITSGRYRPTNHPGADSFPAPAPAAPYGTSLSVLNGHDPSGAWRLFVVDSQTGDGGSISGGWRLEITVTNIIAVPSISVTNVVIDETHSGTTGAVFTVSLSHTSSVPVSVNFATADGTATANSDYIPLSGTIFFPPGMTQQPVAISVTGDLLYEPDETFFLLLSNPTNAIVADADGMGTIRNDDSSPLSDAFAARPVISNSPAFVSGFNTGATREPEEPMHAGNPGGKSVWFAWRAPASGGVNLSFQISTFNPLLAVYTGDALASLKVVVDNQVADGFTNRVNFNAVSNVVYSIAVDGVDGASGDFFLHLRLKPGQFNIASEARAEVWVPNGPVLALEEQNGIIYVGGEFTHFSPNVAKGELLDAASGVPVPDFPKANGPIHAAVSDGSGGWFLGGEFTRIGTFGRTNLAHVLQGNVVDPDWTPWTDGFVFELALVEGRLYIGGSFTNVSAAPRTHLASVNAGTGAVDPWQPLIRHAAEPEMPASVRALAVRSNIVFVGGIFTEVNAQSRACLAALDAASAQVTPWNPSPYSANGAVVHDLLVQDDTVYVGGQFSLIAGQSRGNVAALDFQSGAAMPWVLSVDGAVLNLQATCDTLYLGGEFSTAAGQSRNRLAAGLLPGGTLKPWNPGVNGPRVSRIVLAQDVIYAGGTFSQVGGLSRENLVAIHAATGLPTTWNPGAGIAVEGLAAAGGKVFVGSVHDRGGVARNNIAALDARTGEPLPHWNPNVNGRVTAISMLRPGDKIYIGGDFSTVGGEPRERLAALIRTTGQLLPWDPGANGTPLAIDAGATSVIVGGRFTFAGMAGRTFLAALDPITGEAEEWNPTLNGEVRGFEVNGEVLYLAGLFTSINGFVRNHFAAVNLPNNLVLGWDPQVEGPGGSGESVRVFGSGATLSGSFSQVRGQPRSNLASVDKTTGELFPWNPVAEPAGSSVSTLALFGEFFYAGGSFKRVGGQNRNGLAAIEDLTGGTAPWNPELKSPQSGEVVSALSGASDRVVAGGAFSTIGGRFSPNLAIFPPEGVPRMLREPADQSLPAGGTISLIAEVTGQFPLYYQWRLNGTNIPNATNAILQIPSAQVDHAGRYTLIITNGLGLTRSRSSSVVVYTPIVITTQPASQDVFPGETVVLSVTATGSPPPYYQWRLNGVNIPGAINSTYVIDAAQPRDGGMYSVVAANVGSAASSGPAKVLVFSQPLPFADEFGAAVALTESSFVGSGSNVDATRQVGEPSHAGKFGNKSVWIRWLAPASGIATFNTRGSDFDTLLGIYSGTNITALTGVAGDEDRGGFATSQASFNAVAGTEYVVAVDGLAGAAGQIVLSWQLDTNAVPFPRIVAEPSSKTVRRGEDVEFSVTVNSDSPLSYQWFFGCRPLAGQTNATLNIQNVTLRDVGDYHVLVFNASAQVAQSIDATLEIGPQADVITQDKLADLLANANPFGPRGIAAAGGSSILLVSLGQIDSHIINNSTATNSQDEPLHCGALGGSSKWLSIQADGTGIMQVDTIGSTINTLLAIYVGSDRLSLQRIACDNDGAPDGIRSLVRFNATNGVVYHVVVDGVNGATGDIDINWRFGGVPSVSGSSGPRFPRPGGTLRLWVSAQSHTADIQYQWRRDGRIIAGATNATLDIAAVLPGHIGFYDVIVRNFAGTVIETIGRVEFAAAMQLAIAIGGDGATLNGPAARAYVIQRSTNLIDWHSLHTNTSTVATPFEYSILPVGPSSFYRVMPWP